jgi:prolyl oligopeptidase
MTPAFTPTLFHWFEAGGLLAVPNVRGGGEYGPAWRAAGARDRKQTSFDDVIAAAEWLIAAIPTRPNGLCGPGAVARGGSVVSGRTCSARPVLLSPLADMLRYDRFLQARSWTPEFGAASDPAAFGWLRAYSPYERVTRGTRYPAVLITGSETATAVHALHARKMAARLQAATSADPAERPVLVWIDTADSLDAPGARELQALVDQRVFLMWQLGMN